MEEGEGCCQGFNFFSFSLKKDAEVCEGQGWWQDKNVKIQHSC